MRCDAIYSAFWVEVFHSRVKAIGILRLDKWVWGGWPGDGVLTPLSLEVLELLRHLAQDLVMKVLRQRQMS